MKKLLIIALISFISSCSYSKSISDTLVSKTEESVLKSIPDSSQVTFKEVYSDIKAGLSALSSGLKVGSEHVYEILVKQQVLKAWMLIIIFILSIILVFFGYLIGNKIGWKNDKAAASLVLLVPAFLLFIVTIFNIDTIVTGFVNPEYSAIHEIMNVIK